MSQQVTAMLLQTEVLAPRKCSGLQVFGLRRQDGAGPSYVTLDDALAAKMAEVKEVSEGGAVPDLKVTNRGDSMLFLMSGEQLVGAKQNRILNVSIMVPARDELVVPVSCVERGRWAYSSRTMASSGSSASWALRAMLALQVQQSYRHSGVPRSDQRRIWGAIETQLRSLGSRSASSALEQVYVDQRKRLDSILSDLPAPEGCAGAVFSVQGRIVGADLFDKPETLKKLWPKLIRSYALATLTPASPEAVAPTNAAVRDWIETASRATMQTFKSPGVGDDVRLEGEQLMGGALVVEQRPIHVEVFASVPSVGEQRLDAERAQRSAPAGG